MILIRAGSILILAAFGLLLSPSVAIAVEIDDITGYYTPLKDANAQLNPQINLVLAKSLEITKTCQYAELIENTKAVLRPRGLFAKIFGGGFEEFVLSAKDIEKYSPEIDTSIYQNTPYSRSYIANGAKIIRIATIYPSIRLNGILVGVDKLSHFFETGLELYLEFLTPEALSKSGRDVQLQALVQRSVELEETHLGWTMTGIKSYGDVQAHLQGAIFWAQYFKANGAWLSCEKDKFVLKKKFDIGAFVQTGWSEAVQCNEYAPNSEETYLQKFFNPNSKTFQQEVDMNIEALEKKFQRRYQCPLEPKSCESSDQFLKKNLHFLSADQFLKITSPGCR